MNTISTAAYAAVAATTSKGLLMVAPVPSKVKRITNPVIIPSRSLLLGTFCIHHKGASSIESPKAIMLSVVKLSKAWSLE